MDTATGKIVTVFGGSGFLGRHVVRALAQRGYRVRIAVRRPDLAGFMQPMGNVGQIMPVQANLRDKASIERAIAGADAVVNLVGILYETRKQSFAAVHRDGAKAISEACAKAGTEHLVQISAIGADVASPSAYAKSKGEGEAAVLAAFPDAVIVRPSLLIGNEDDFFNKFAQMSKLSPFLPLVGGGGTKFQPAFVGDVAEVIARGVDGALKGGTIYELGGPEVKSFKSLLKLLMDETKQRRLLLPIPYFAASLMGAVFEKLPKPMLTRDQVTLLKRDNVVSEQAALASTLWRLKRSFPPICGAIAPWGNMQRTVLVKARFRHLPPA